MSFRSAPVARADRSILCLAENGIAGRPCAKLPRDGVLFETALTCPFFARQPVTEAVPYRIRRRTGAGQQNESDAVAHPDNDLDSMDVSPSGKRS